jgi:hypothetical protein
VSMSYTHIMPGASILAYTTPNISKEAKNGLRELSCGIFESKTDEKAF